MILAKKLKFRSKIGDFFIFLVLSKIGQNKVSCDLLHSKRVFVDYKNIGFKDQKKSAKNLGLN